MQKTYFVYMMASKSRVIYVGVTSNLYNRVIQHKTKHFPNSFSARYYVNKLVYFEEYNSIYDAIDREKQIKRWRREKKVKLILSVNPKWKDFSNEVGFSEKSMNQM